MVSDMPYFFTDYLSDLAGQADTRAATQRSLALKRGFDLTLALAIAAPVCVLVLAITLWLRLRQGGPVFFVSERIGQGGVPFQLLKFRTMVPAADTGIATGGDKGDRVTVTGRWLRARRLDELPQLWNVIRGDLSFVGPRPPLRRYVERHENIYRQVLTSIPGITGLGTLIYNRFEQRILAGVTKEAETDLVYSRRCVPRKARLDLIYQRNGSLAFDIYILWQTLMARR